MQEIWRDVVGYEGLYQVSNLGNVYSVRSKKILKPVTLKIGYSTVVFPNKTRVYIHRLVAQAFISNPENKREVNHKNGIRNDNRVDNLEWVTPSENIRHCFDVLGYKGSAYGKTPSEETRKKLSKANSKPVLCVELNKVFDSGYIASQWLGLNKHSIANAIHGGWKCGGYTWEYIKKGE